MTSKVLPASARFNDSGSFRSAVMLPTFLPKSCRVFRCRIETSCPALSNSFTSARPMNRVPPITRIFRLAGSCLFDPLVVVLEPKVCNQILSAHPTQGVLQLHQLDENIVLRIQARRSHGSLEVERKPLLNALHSSALRQVHEQNQVQHEGRGQYRIPA